MRSLRWFIVVALGCLTWSPTARAADFQEKRFNITPMVGWTFFDRELRDVNASGLSNAPYFGGRVGARLMSPLWLDLAGGVTRATGCADCDILWTHLTGNLMLVSSGPQRVHPFISVGGGISQFDPLPRRFWSESKRDGVVEAAGGFKIRLSDAIGLRLEARNVLLVPKTHWDQSHIDNVIVGAGLTFAFGGEAADADGDGVDDRKDRCPETPRGCRVDLNGCPTDSDGDGVCDGLDGCPETPHGATVNSSGCPGDADRDGVVDGLDRCPETRRGCRVDEQGCAIDSDGDGVCDGFDQCTNTKSGCKVDANGCLLDADGDGVCDGLDACPNTPGGTTVDEDGCPPTEVRRREIELIDTGRIVLRDVHFETAKAAILPESYPALDVVGEVLSKWPRLMIEIGGHCDSRGSEAYNLSLSDRRAASVRDYLTRHFPKLEPAQLKSKGYGESEPQVPNTSPENMAKNRRVEFTVLNREVLKQPKP